MIESLIEEGKAHIEEDMLERLAAAGSKCRRIS